MNRIVSKIKEEGLLRFSRHAADYLGERLGLFTSHLSLKAGYSFSRKPYFRNYNGIKFIFTNSGDIQEVLYHYRWDKYFNEEAKKIQPYLKAGDVVIDIGANLGFFALLTNSLLEGRCRIHCFEPSARIFRRLELNISSNKNENIFLHPYACGAAEGEAEITVDEEFSGMSSIVLGVGQKASAEKIKVVSLDSYLPNHTQKIDFIKIDTEGFEPEVLSGCRNILLTYRPIVYIELGGGKFYDSSCKAHGILTDLGYQLNVTKEQLKYVHAGVNFIAVPAEKN